MMQTVIRFPALFFDVYFFDQEIRIALINLNQAFYEPNNDFYGKGIFMPRIL